MRGVRFIAAALGLLAALGMLMPLRARAVNEYSIVDGVKYQIFDDEGAAMVLELTVGGDVVIPETAAGYTVVSVGYAAAINNRDLTSLELPDTVESIGADAFSGCTALVNVHLGSSLDYIGEGAFRDCYNLVGIDFGERLTEIGDEAFRGCMSLYAVDFPESLEVIGDRAFADSLLLTEITLPDGLKEIGDRAFGFYNGYDAELGEDRLMPQYLIIRAGEDTEGAEYARIYDFDFIPLERTGSLPGAESDTDPEEDEPEDSGPRIPSDRLMLIIVPAALLLGLIILGRVLFKPDKRYDSKGNRLR